MPAALCAPAHTRKDTGGAGPGGSGRKTL